MYIKNINQSKKPNIDFKKAVKNCFQSYYQLI